MNAKKHGGKVMACCKKATGTRGSRHLVNSRTSRGSIRSATSRKSTGSIRSSHSKSTTRKYTGPPSEAKVRMTGYPANKPNLGVQQKTKVTVSGTIMQSPPQLIQSYDQDSPSYYMQMTPSEISSPQHQHRHHHHHHHQRQNYQCENPRSPGVPLNYRSPQTNPQYLQPINPRSTQTSNTVTCAGARRNVQNYSPEDYQIEYNSFERSPQRYPESCCSQIEPPMPQEEQYYEMDQDRQYESPQRYMVGTCTMNPRQAQQQQYQQKLVDSIDSDESYYSSLQSQPQRMIQAPCSSIQAPRSRLKLPERIPTTSRLQTPCSKLQSAYNYELQTQSSEQSCISGIQGPSSRSQIPTSRLQAPMSRLQAPMSRLQAPMSRLQPPMSRLQAQISGLDAPAPCSQAPISRLQASASEFEAPAPCSQASISRSEESDPYLQAPIYRFGAPAPCSEAPISRLQLPTSRLQAPLSRLQAPMSRLQAPMSRSQIPMSRLQAPMSRSQVPISRLQAPISRMQAPISRMQAPMPRMQVPMSRLQAPTPRLQPSTSRLHVSCSNIVQPSSSTRLQSPCQTYQASDQTSQQIYPPARTASPVSVPKAVISSPLEYSQKTLQMDSYCQSPRMPVYSPQTNISPVSPKSSPIITQKTNSPTCSPEPLASKHMNEGTPCTPEESESAPINILDQTNIPCGAELSVDLIKSLIEEEKRDLMLSQTLSPDLDNKLKRLKCKDILEETLQETILATVGDDLDESRASSKSPERKSPTKSDVLANLIYSEERGIIDTGSSPKQTYTALFGADGNLGDEKTINVSPAAPAPLHDIVIPVGEATQDEVTILSQELEQQVAQTDQEIPKANAFSEYLGRRDTIQLTKKDKLIKKDSKVRKDEVGYISVRELDEQKAPWDINLDMLEELVGGQMSFLSTGENLPSDESIRATLGRFEYVLDVEKPKHYSCVQLRGTQKPVWFPGYYYVNPEVAPETIGQQPIENYIRLEDNPNKVFSQMWNIMKPNNMQNNSEIVFL